MVKCHLSRQTMVLFDAKLCCVSQRALYQTLSAGTDHLIGNERVHPSGRSKRWIVAIRENQASTKPARANAALHCEMPCLSEESSRSYLASPAQSAGQTDRQGCAHSAVPVADAKPLAQSHRTQMGARQAQRRRARWLADREAPC